MVLRRQSEAFLPILHVIGKVPLLLPPENVPRTSFEVRLKRFTGTLITCIVSVIVILATASIAMDSITESIQLPL